MDDPLWHLRWGEMAVGMVVDQVEDKEGEKEAYKMDKEFIKEIIKEGIKETDEGSDRYLFGSKIPLRICVAPEWPLLGGN